MSEIAGALEAKKSKRRLIAFFTALFIVLCAGAIFSTLIYGNSPGGMGYLFGEFIGAGFVASLLGFPARQTTYMPAAVLIATGLFVGIANAPKLIESIDAREGMKALTGLHDPPQIDKALDKNPSNTFLQLTAGTIKLAQETGRATERLSAEIEPPGLANINLTSASRDDLRGYLSSLQIAEINAAAAMPSYVALLKKERSEIENLSRSLKISDSVTRDLLKGVDSRQGRELAFASKMMAARAELYRALENYTAILIQQHGRYTVDANGQYHLADRSALDGFNVAANAVNAATKKVNELDGVGKQLENYQQEGWKNFVDKTH